MENAGFEIIGAVTTNIDAKEGVCLGYKYTSFGAEWVTWAFTDRENGRSYYWGHYFRDSVSANRDFSDRVRRGY